MRYTTATEGPIRPEIHTLVVGVAGPADPVLGDAVELARALKASLHVVHAYHAPAAVNGRALGPAHAEILAEAEQFRLEEAVRERFPRGEIACHAVEGPVSECLAELALLVGAGLIALGRPRRGATGARPGSTAEAVLREAGVPVVLLDGAGEEAVRRALRAARPVRSAA